MPKRMISEPVVARVLALKLGRHLVMVSISLRIRSIYIVTNVSEFFEEELRKRKLIMREREG